MHVCTRLEIKWLLALLGHGLNGRGLILYPSIYGACKENKHWSDPVWGVDGILEGKMWLRGCKGVQSYFSTVLPAFFFRFNPSNLLNSLIQLRWGRTPQGSFTIKFVLKLKQWPAVAHLCLYEQKMMLGRTMSNLAAISLNFAVISVFVTKQLSDVFISIFISSGKWLQSNQTVKWRQKKKKFFSSHVEFLLLLCRNQKSSIFLSFIFCSQM